MTRQVSEEGCAEVQTELRQFLASRPDVSLVTLTHYTNLSDTAGRNFLNGHLPGGRQVIGEFRRVLDLARRGEILPPGGQNGKVILTETGPAQVARVTKRHDYYETEFARKVAELLDYCNEHSTIGIVTADFGAGKTEALKAWRQGNGRNTPSLVYEFTEFSSANTVEFVRDLATMLSLDMPRGSQTGGKIFRAVSEKLLESPHLLIFDQCETVRARICQVIRQVWDRTHEAGVGVVLLAAPILLARMTMSRTADLGALTSRVGIWAPLSGVSRAEMAAIVKREGILDIEEPAFEMWWRAVAGSMRRLMRGIDLLRAKHAGKRITEKTIASMAAYLWGMQVRTEGA